MEAYQIQVGVALYYLTFTVSHWLPVFVSSKPCLILTESLNLCHSYKGLRVNAFVIMPTHLHLIVFDADFDNKHLQNTITAMSQYTRRQLTDGRFPRWVPPVWRRWLQQIGVWNRLGNCKE